MLEIEFKAESVVRKADIASCVLRAPTFNPPSFARIRVAIAKPAASSAALLIDLPLDKRFIAVFILSWFCRMYSCVRMLLMFVLILMLRNPHFFILIFLLIVKRKYAKKSISRLIVILGIYRVNE